ncbi:molybdopterin molybdochelatase [Archaeoglobus sulfaticallidus PM70-1]|uniref:molybdopterin molybdotransferase n=1 Tax=Archaeoglobus sulfaticallidus PM70-1 TaxID=387631 RepID=N0BEW6_9EURY|nr:molybdopterin biosynthesis protein [Archaeoglobus sulfaticallidus]AGK60817.1 molybdopterin molybdochelatase [Archaeoglobus sulfaticallidus PM70-1]
MSRKVFRELIPESKVISIINGFKVEPTADEVELKEAYNRVVFEDYYARIDVPPFDRSTMDGYAVIASDTFQADEDSPVRLKVAGRVSAGDHPSVVVEEGTAVEISTGAVIPSGANAVVMEEYTSMDGEYVNIYRPVAPGENIMPAGSDIMAGELIVRAGTVLTAREIGVLSSSGYDRVKVFRKPRVAVFSTGNEIVSPGRELEFGKIYDINSYAIMASLMEDGAEPVFLGVARDDEKEIEEMINRALDYDVIICSGGTSAGSGDMIYKLLDRWDPGVVVHGISVKPGKPTIVAMLGNKPAFGLPGNPTSALMIYNVFVSPLIRKLSGMRKKRISVKARLAVKTFSSHGRVEYLPVNLVMGKEGYSAYPVSGHYSGAITSLSRSDGFIRIDEDISIVDEGSEVEVTLFSESIKPADLMIIGSHCIGLDVIYRILREKDASISVKIINAGSTGGILAVKRGEADIAGTHLLDESGEYNIPFIKKYGLKSCYLVKGYIREQGIIVQKGNPLGIKCIEDLVDLECRIVNRNRGSGTRVLFDMYLKEIADKKGIEFRKIVKKLRGYEIEAKSHTSVAVSVLMNKADAGLGIKTVADRYSLDFIPLRGEEYDFLISKDRFSKDVVQEFIDVLRSEELRRSLPNGLKVYERTGEVIEL